MFKVKANPTFPATVTIVGQGREQKLDLVFRHKKRAEYLDMLERMKDGALTTVEAIQEIVESWDADIGLDAAGITELMEEQPGADWAIVQAYGEALAVARKGN